MEIGHTYTLKVARTVDFGVYLDSPFGDILLPIKYVPEGTEPGSELSVFVHRDSEDRLLATTLIPAGEVGDTVVLKVKDITLHGAFMDWGLEKDLFVPQNEQHVPFQPGESYVIRILLDHRSDRIMGTSKLNTFINKDPSSLSEGEKVDLVIFDKTSLGYKALINGSFQGLLYESEVFQPLNIGQQIDGYIKQVREDNKVDLSLYPPGVSGIDQHKTSLLDKLETHNGFLPLTDKSSPEEIMETVRMSKKAFKKALGGLYKARLVKIDEKGIHKAISN